MIERNNTHFVAVRPQSPNRKGIALILTMAILVILTTIVYGISSRVSVYKHRQEYIINYQSARYACDSALEYAQIRVKKVKTALIEREDSPDFSDLFVLDHEQYQEMLNAWAQEQNEKILAQAEEQGYAYPEGNTAAGMANEHTGMGAVTDDDPNEGEPGIMSSLFASLQSGGKLVDSNDLEVPGPYGYEWPLICKPIEFNIGNAKIEILFKDENAKFPLVLALNKDTKIIRQTQDALAIFCEWMRMDIEEIEILALQLEYLTEYKEYSLKMKPIIINEVVKSTPAKPTKTSRSRPRRTTTARTSSRTKRITRPAVGNTSDFAKLLHSSIITTSKMEKPLPQMGERHESAMKYLGIWGVDKVNINTAPRHVLEAVFALGGDQELIAQDIITQRKIKPYATLNDLKELHYGYNDSIEIVKPYLTTTSTFFTIEIKAVCGNATASSIVLIEKKNTAVTTIAMTSI